MSTSKRPAPVGDDAPRRASRWWVRWWVRWRALIVLIPLLAALVVAGAYGARMLFSPSTSSAGPPVTCWDGTTAPASDCSLPSGVEGLQWVFPRFDPASRQCRETQAADESRGLVWTCRQRLNGARLAVEYVERTDVRRGLATLADRYPDVDPRRTSDGTRFVWKDPRRGEGGFSTAIAYAEYPYSVSVSSPRRSVRDRAVRRLARLRPADQVTVRPTS